MSSKGGFGAYRRRWVFVPSQQLESHKRGISIRALVALQSTHSSGSALSDTWSLTLQCCSIGFGTSSILFYETTGALWFDAPWNCLAFWYHEEKIKKKERRMGGDFCNENPNNWNNYYNKDLQIANLQWINAALNSKKLTSLILDNPKKI